MELCGSRQIGSVEGVIEGELQLIKALDCCPGSVSDREVVDQRERSKGEREDANLWEAQQGLPGA